MTVILIFVVFVMALVPTTTSSVLLFKTLKKNTAEINEVHKIVNQQRTDMINYQKTLQSQGIDVPINPNPSN